MRLTHAGLCLCYQVPTGTHLSQAFLKIMAGREPNLNDLHDFDAEMANSLQAVLEASPSTLYEMGLTFDTGNGINTTA